MSGLLDWLLGKPEQPQNPAVFRKCTYCYWSNYQGKTCSRTNPPTNIIEVGQAQMCDSYTVTPPDWVTPAVEALQVSTAVKLDTLKNSADATKAAVEAVASKTDLVKAAVDNKQFLVTVSASDNILVSNDEEKTTTSGTYVKLKEFVIAANGTYRVKFEAKSSESAYRWYAKIYKNDVAYSDEWNAGGISFLEKIADLFFHEGDKCQLYAYCTGGRTVTVRNFRLCGDVSSAVAIVSPV